MKSKILVLAAALALPACASLADVTTTDALIEEARDRTGFAAPAALDGPMTMDVAVAMALANDQSLRADLTDAGIAGADWVTASRPQNPVLEAVWIDGGDHGDIYDIDVTASVVSVLTTPWRARAARARYDAAEAQALGRAIDAIAEVRGRWVDAVAARQRLDLQIRIRAAADAALLVAEELFAAGNIPAIDLERERAFAAAARLDELAAERAARRAALQLAAAMGTTQEIYDRLPDRLDRPAGLAGDNAETRAIEASLALSAARLAADASGREARIENLDSLLEHAELGIVREREDGDWNEGFVVETAIPLFDLGAGRRAAAELRARQALDRLAATAVSVRTATRLALADHEVAMTRLAHVEESVLPVSERLLDESMRHYNAMQIGVFDLIAAFELRTEAGQSYVDAIAAAHRAEIELARLLAGGTPRLAGAEAETAGSTSVTRSGGH